MVYRTLLLAVLLFTPVARTMPQDGRDEIFPPKAAAQDAILTRAEPIDRHALVTRHNVVLTAAHNSEELQVGNGHFAYGVDVTGLQTFYGNTMSDWSWHTSPRPPELEGAKLRLQMFDVQGRQVGYPTDPKGQTALFNYLRANPHRFNLGRLGLRLLKQDGSVAVLRDLTGIRQELDLWHGLITSHFIFEGEPVTVETTVHPDSDLIAVCVKSPLLGMGRLLVSLAFPYGDPGTSGGDYDHPLAHTTTLTANGTSRADFHRTMDSTRYDVSLAWEGDAKIAQEEPHFFLLCSATGSDSLGLSCRFEAKPDETPLSTVAQTEEASAASWEKFWKEGGAVDLSGSTDPRWMELERRIVLSQYLLAVQEAGSTPPQESGLFHNGWNGKFHLEMVLWHEAQYALWNRWPLFQRCLDWYPKILPSSKERAQSQGYAGARWPKMVGPDGVDSPSPVGPLLIWQEPHPIFFAELDYRLHPNRATLDKWSEIVESTADFMASYATLDPATGKYNFVPPLQTVPENTGTLASHNPTFELSYWRTGLRLAQQWRTRLGLPLKPEWDKVRENLAPLPQADGVYLMQEGMTNTYTKMNFEHPSLIGALGLLPGDGVDPTVMKATVAKVASTWQWGHTWSWDLPMMAMAAARNGDPKLAVDALFNPRNHFLANGCSTGGPYPYFPSNGGLLYAIALMAAGWDGAPDQHAPGFPNDGTWHVRFEDLSKAP